MHVANWFNVGASIIIRYVDIICDVLINKNELFSKNINIPFNEWHQCLFWKSYSLHNICGVINGTEIPLKVKAHYNDPLLGHFWV
jgi:hypothetical protein